MSPIPARRFHMLDALRGLLLVNMIAYHGIWDLVYLLGFRMDWYTGLPGYLWQQWICWSFVLLSGFCWSFSRRHLRRGGLVFGAGLVVMLVTNLLMPENRVLFGILTCMGSCMLLMIPAEGVLRHLPAGLGLALSFGAFLLLRNCPQGSLGFENFVLAALPESLYRNLATAWLGFPPPSFWSTDYFPVIPWFFLFGTGYFLNRLLAGKEGIEKFLARGNVPVLDFLGRHSLVVYLIHQPLLYGLCMGLQFVMR